jgi:hypothetical protein
LEKHITSGDYAKGNDTISLQHIKTMLSVP